MRESTVQSPHLVHKGDRYSRFQVLGFSHNDKHWRRHYKVRCDCGTIKTVQGTLLRSGNTRSCGCLSKEIKAAQRLPNNRGVINHLILQYKRHAKDRRLNFQLSYEDFESLIRENCSYCGLAPDNKVVTKNCKEGFLYSGIDRVNPDKGYVKNNCVPACCLCNRAKRDLSRKDFMLWIERLKNKN